MMKAKKTMKNLVVIRWIGKWYMCVCLCVCVYVLMCVSMVIMTILIYYVGY